jgi:hypothetical protein
VFFLAALFSPPASAEENASNAGNRTPYFPLAVGNIWKFRATSPENEYKVTWEITKREIIEKNKSARYELAVAIDKPGEPLRRDSVSVFENDDSIFFWDNLQELQILPVPAKIGRKWDVSANERRVAHNGEITGAVKISVGAGVFENALVARLSPLPGSNASITFAFAEGVGPVKITSGETVFELVWAKVGEKIFCESAEGALADCFPLAAGNRWELLTPSGRRATLTVAARLENGAWLVEKTDSASGNSSFLLSLRKDSLVISKGGIFVSPAGGAEYEILKPAENQRASWNTAIITAGGEIGATFELSGPENVSTTAGGFADCITAAVRDNAGAMLLKYTFAPGVGLVSVTEFYNSALVSASLDYFQIFRTREAFTGDKLPGSAFEKMKSLFLAKDFKPFHAGLSSRLKSGMGEAEFVRLASDETAYALCAGMLARGRIRSCVITGKRAQLAISSASEKEKSGRIETIIMSFEDGEWRLDRCDIIEMLKR